MAKQMLKMKVRATLMQCFDGEKIVGGKEISRDEFKRSRTAKITMYGELENGEACHVLLTPRLDGPGEFMKLVDIIEREGEFEVLGELKEKAVINGEEIIFDTPRIECELTDQATGEAAFKFTPRKVAKWAAEYGEYKTPCINFGKDEAAAAAFAQRKRDQRRARRSGTQQSGGQGGAQL